MARQVQQINVGKRESQIHLHFWPKSVGSVPNQGSDSRFSTSSPFSRVLSVAYDLGEAQLSRQSALVVTVTDSAIKVQTKTVIPCSHKIKPR